MSYKHTMDAICNGTSRNPFHPKNTGRIVLFQMISVCKHVLDNPEMLKEGILQQFIIKYYIIAMF